MSLLKLVKLVGLVKLVDLVKPVDLVKLVDLVRQVKLFHLDLETPEIPISGNTLQTLVFCDGSDGTSV